MYWIFERGNVREVYSSINITFFFLLNIIIETIQPYPEREIGKIARIKDRNRRGRGVFSVVGR